MSIKSVFDKHSEEYDGARRRLIPCFDDFYRIAISSIPFDKDRNIKVLDLGAGTGLSSEMVLLAYPEAEITLVDVSGKMLAIAKSRLGRFQNKIEYREEDYTKVQIEGEYDLIISSLSIHHLNDNEKRHLFGNCYHSLAVGGAFINADQVLGETPEIDKTYRERWLKEVRGNGATEIELAAAFERMKEDKMSTLPYQLSCLREAGFSETKCWYKYYSFVVFGGTKR